MSDGAEGGLKSTAGSAEGMMPLAEVLQVICLGRKTGRVTFTSLGRSGTIYIQYGQLLHAALGTTEGTEAIFQMLQWPGGSFTLEESVLPNRRTIDVNWDTLLLEGVQRMDEGSAASPTQSTHSTSAVATSKLQGTQPRLVILTGPSKGTVYEVSAEFTHIGRTPENEIALSDVTISGRHCVLVKQGPDILIRDLHSANGTLVNGHPVTEIVLQLGDRVQVGAVELQFESGIRRPKLSAQQAGQSADVQTMGSPLAIRPATKKIKTSHLDAVERSPGGVATLMGSNKAIVYRQPAPSTAQQARAIRPTMLIALIVFMLLAGVAAWLLIVR